MRISTQRTPQGRLAMPIRLCPRSIQGRVTLAAVLLSLIVFSVIGICLDSMIRTRIEGGIYAESQRIAASLMTWRPEGTPQPKLRTRINLLQIVDAHGRVVLASKAAAGRAPLTTMRPSMGDRIRYGTACLPQGEC